MSYIENALSGLQGGAVIAALAIGLVLTFRASNVINLAHGAIGMYSAYVYFGLRNFKLASTELGGDLVLPIIGAPSKVHLLDRPTASSAFLVAIAIAIGLGALLYGFVFRPLRSAPPLARVVASLGVFLYLQSVMNVRVKEIGAGALSLQLESLLPQGVVRIGSAKVPTAAFALAGLVIACAVALGVLFRFTRFGLATRAAAEQERGAILTGISPNRLGVFNWMLASGLAGVSVILITGVQQKIDPTETSLLIVPALAAALLGRLDGFGLTTVAGLAIGMTQGAVSWFQLRASLPSWMPNGGLAQAVPLIVILAAISLRGSSLPNRAALLERQLPESPVPKHPVLWTSLLFVGATVALFTLDAQWRLAIVVSIIAGFIGLASVVVTGYVGQISLAQYAFAGLAAFGTAKLAIQGLPFPFAPIVAIAITVFVGILMGLPAVRVRGMTLAVATIAAAVAIEQLVFASSSLTGLESPPRPRLFGIDLGFTATGDNNFRAAFGMLALVLLCAAIIVVANLRRSATGLRWLAVRGNERAAAAAGIDVSRTKLSAFAVSALLAGIGGSLLAYESPSLSSQQFMVVGALAVLALCYLGGIASISGALMAGVLASGGVLTQLQGGNTGNASSYQFAVSGLLLVVVAVLYPDGVIAGLRNAITRWSKHAGKNTPTAGTQSTRVAS